MQGLPGGCKMPMGPNSETNLEAKRGRVPSPRLGRAVTRGWRTWHGRSPRSEGAEEERAAGACRDLTTPRRRPCMSRHCSKRLGQQRRGLLVQP